MALFYLELNKKQEVVQVFEDNLMKTGSNLDMINSSSLLFRLKLDNEEAYNSNDYLTGKYNKLKETFISRLDERGYLFTHLHIGLIGKHFLKDLIKIFYFKFSLLFFFYSHSF